MTDLDLEAIEKRIGVTKQNLGYLKMKEAKAGATWVIEDIERLIAEVRRLSRWAGYLLKEALEADDCGGIGMGSALEKNARAAGIEPCEEPE